MNARIAAIIQRARATLADPNAERWTDPRLFQLVSEGHQDLVKALRVLRKDVNLYLDPYLDYYTLPSDVFVLTRASFNGIELEFRTWDELDNTLCLEEDWQKHQGPAPKYLVYDRFNLGRIRTYPIISPQEPTEHAPMDGPSGVYGVVTGYEGWTFDSLDGVVTKIFDPNLHPTPFNLTRLSGLVTDITSAPLVYINIQYFALAPDLGSEDPLLTPALFDTALKYYVISHALMDDIDVRYRQMGTENLQLYERELALAAPISRLNGTANRERQTNYITPFQR